MNLSNLEDNKKAQLYDKILAANMCNFMTLKKRNAFAGYWIDDFKNSDVDKITFEIIKLISNIEEVKEIVIYTKGFDNFIKYLEFKYNNRKNNIKFKRRRRKNTDEIYKPFLQSLKDVANAYNLDIKVYTDIYNTFYNIGDNNK